MVFLKNGQAELTKEVHGLKEGQKKLEVGQKKLEEGQRQLQSDVTEIKLGQERLQKNIIDSLGTYTEKIAEHVDYRTDALNKRVYRLEIEVERMSRQ
ncbi:hypothetical protein BKP35_09925 [Anaerobacillus arseniciselenatis]|uniref:Uncharacterized protein n=1 Tax=Anaerobacillus arseniciselenatis TaxID=85682 RepID=A0A1S2LKY1_9BACI|nr:hypothetical protein BKP35_09925 [Anaerobacillus arseniciselenatis]